ncbi:3-dehydroquinate synthase II [Streptomyces sp. NPDC101151]|uniref:3-dehydroquinate synthase II n=1 Tax=Streptomyces sp. NPDC101151 TaxID=3366115 RepID=UPI0037F244E9
MTDVLDTKSKTKSGGAGGKQPPPAADTTAKRAASPKDADPATDKAAFSARRYTWHDFRRAGDRPGLDELYDAVLRVHPGAAVVVDEDQLGRVPDGLRKVKILSGVPSEDKLARIREDYDVLVLDADVVGSNWFTENKARIGISVGASVDVVDPASLDLAVEMTRAVPLLLVTFKDDTKIPLEIVLADAQNHGTDVVMGVRDSVEANVVFGVLEIGANGVMTQVTDLSAVYALGEVVVAAERIHGQELSELTVLETRHVGMGDRACLDFTSYLGLDEGVLLGCFSSGGILATSETHPLPYMPTRPFRVNAGSLQMYVLAPGNRTWYLSDLRAGMEVLAVKTDGTARPVTVGRVKIERRPMLQIKAQAPDGTLVTTIMQEDWHVRVFGTDSRPRNITELKPGDRLYGYTTDPGRHVGVKVDELIIEQ